MGKKINKRLQKAKDMTDKPIPGGYVTYQLLDAIRMVTSDINRDIEAVTRLSVSEAEFYRLLAKFSIKLQQIDKSVSDLNEIFRTK